jgi:hypothetical protein
MLAAHLPSHLVVGPTTRLGSPSLRWMKATSDPAQGHSHSLFFVSDPAAAKAGPSRYRYRRRDTSDCHCNRGRLLRAERMTVAMASGRRLRNIGEDAGGRDFGQADVEWPMSGLDALRLTSAATARGGGRGSSCSRTGLGNEARAG